MKIIKINLAKNIAISGAFLAILATSVCFGAEQKSYIGGLVGANIPNGDQGSSNSATYGLELGTKLSPNFGISAFGTYYGQNNSGSFLGLDAGTHTHTINAAGEANIYTSALHIGGDIGESFTGWSGNVGNGSLSTSGNTMIYGPEAGLDIPLGGLSIGAEAHYLFNNASSSNNNLLALASLKIWF